MTEHFMRVKQGIPRFDKTSGHQKKNCFYLFILQKFDILMNMTIVFKAELDEKINPALITVKHEAAAAKLVSDHTQKSSLFN